MKTLADAILARNHAVELVDIADNHAAESARENALIVVPTGGGFAGWRPLEPSTTSFVRRVSSIRT